MKEGADSIYTARGPHVVEMLARENIPVMCHLGLVPRKSTWKGGLRAIGTTCEEAKSLWEDFRCKSSTNLSWCVNQDGRSLVAMF